jgi:hypothetical protein
VTGIPNGRDAFNIVRRPGASPNGMAQDRTFADYEHPDWRHRH